MREFSEVLNSSTARGDRRAARSGRCSRSRWLFGVIVVGAALAFLDAAPAHAQDKFALDLGSRVESLVFSPDGKLIAAAGDNGVKIWDVATGALKRAWLGGEDNPDGKGIKSIAFTRDGKRLVFGNGYLGVLDLGSGKDRYHQMKYDPLTHRWDFADPKQEVPCEQALLEPGGKWVACGGTSMAPVKVDVDKLARVESVPVEAGPKIDSRVMALSPDGKKIVYSYRGLDLRILDTVTWKQTGTIPVTDGNVRALAFSPDGKLLAIGGSINNVPEPFLVWDLEAGKSLDAIAGTEGIDDVHGVAFSPDGKFLLTADRISTSARLWNLTRKKLKARLGEHKPAATRVAVSPDGSLIASGGDDNMVRIWEMP